MPTRYDVGPAELAELLTGEPRYRVEQVWAGLYEQLAEPAAMTNLPKALRGRLDELLPPSLTLLVERVSDDGAHDEVPVASSTAAASIETVLMLYPDRATVCVSAARPAARWAAASAPPGRPDSPAS